MKGNRYPWRPRYGCVRTVIRHFADHRGQVTLLVAVALAVLVLLSGTTVALSVGQKRAGVFYGDRLQAYYTAEDGVEEVLARILQDWDVLAEIPSGSECRLLYERPAPEGSLQVKGRQKTLPGAVELRLETRGEHRNAVSHVLFEAVLYPPLDFADGIRAGGWIAEQPDGEELSCRPAEKPAPDFEPEWFRRRAERVTDGNGVLCEGKVNGLYYVDGDLAVHGGRYEGRAIYFVAGNIDIIGDYYPGNSTSGCVVFLTPSDIRIAPGVSVRVLVAAGGEVRLEDAAKLQGGLIADRVYAGPETVIEPDHGLISESLPVFSRSIDVRYWGEMYNVFYGRTNIATG